MLSLVQVAALVGCLFVDAARADASSELPTIPKDKTTPVQQRLGLHGPTTMAVGWNTFEHIAKPTVHFGLSPAALWFSASSKSSETYPTSRTWANTVLIEDLLPATTYYYKIDSTNSSIDSFKTGRIAGDHTPFSAALVIDMGVFGANGLTVTKRDHVNPRSADYIPPSLEHTTIDRLAKTASEYEFVIHPGDLSYADTWISGESSGQNPGNLTDGVVIYEALVEQFYDQLSVVSRMKPYMVGAGNHEADCNEDTNQQNLCPIGQTNFTGYINRFGGMMPAAPATIFGRDLEDEFAETFSPREVNVKDTAERRRASDTRVKAAEKRSAKSLANPPFWYSFDYGMAHIVVFNTETDLGNGLVGPEELGGDTGLNDGPFGKTKNQQIEFLKADLASVDRKITPWVIAAGHRPWYTIGGGCNVCQEAFEPILNQYGVDLAVFGHVHNMQRLLPVYNNTLDPAGLNNPKAPWYIVSGAAGNPEGLSSISSDKSTYPNYVGWANGATFGFSLLKFVDRNHLTVEFISSTNGTIMDSATLYKKH